MFCRACSVSVAAVSVSEVTVPWAWDLCVTKSERSLCSIFLSFYVYTFCLHTPGFCSGSLFYYKVHFPRFLYNFIPLQKNDLLSVCFNINNFWPCLMLACHSRFIQASTIILLWKKTQNLPIGSSCVLPNFGSSSGSCFLVDFQVQAYLNHPD